MKFKFNSEDCDGSKLTLEFEAGTWYEALSEFVKFLQGTGYSVENDSIGINLANKHYGADYFEFEPKRYVVFNQGG